MNIAALSTNWPDTLMFYLLFDLSVIGLIVIAYWAFKFTYKIANRKVPKNHLHYK